MKVLLLSREMSEQKIAADGVGATVLGVGSELVFGGSGDSDLIRALQLSTQSTTNRAGQRRGWTTESFTPCGERLAKRYKTLLAIRKPASGVIRALVRCYCGEPAAAWRPHMAPRPRG